MQSGRRLLGIFVAACLVVMATADPKPLDVAGAYHEVGAHITPPVHTGPNLGKDETEVVVGREISREMSCGLEQEASKAPGWKVDRVNGRDGAREGRVGTNSF